MNFFNKKLFKFWLPVLLIFIAVFIVLAQFYLSDKPSVLYKYKDKAAVDPGNSLFVVFNPFRDKTPEFEAENVLEQLREGNCKEIGTDLEIDCDRETTSELMTWNLVDREEQTDRIRLHYAVYRRNNESRYSNVWITLQNESGSWKARSFEAWY